MIQPADSVRIALFSLSNPDRFLILCETDDPTNWKLPGGKFERSETPEQAAQRELDEELGLKFAPQLAGELTNDDGVSKRFIFAAKLGPDQIKPSGEISNTAWVTLQSIPDGPNRAHITTAVNLAQAKLQTKNPA